MTISSAHAYRLAEKRRLPLHLFHCIDGARTTRAPWPCRGASRGLPFTLSAVLVRLIEEVQPAMTRPMWFHLYVAA